jgi:hypothetical protein
VLINQSTISSCNTARYGWLGLPDTLKTIELAKKLLSLGYTMPLRCSHNGG